MSRDDSSQIQTNTPQIGLLAPNPNTRRGYRVCWSLHPQETHIAYPCQNNVIIRSIKEPNAPSKNVVFTDFMTKVTCVKYSPNGQFIAAGDDKGKVKIFSYNEDSKEFLVKKEHQMLAGQVYSISWTDDGQRIIASGAGKDIFAKAILVDSGSKVGDITGPGATLTTSDIKGKPYRLILGGENNEVYAFDGVPFKYVKTLQPHSNFVNRVLFRGDGKQFVTVSSDKTIVVHDTETLEQVQKIEKAHTKGILDVAWIDENTLMTSSSDNTLKIWNLEAGAEIKTLTLSEDTTEKVENQQLALIAEQDTFWSVTLNSNINLYHGKDVFKYDKTTPTQIIQGHSVNIKILYHLQNYPTALVFNDQTLVSSDQDGKIFSWSLETNQADLFKGEGHQAQVSHLASCGPFIFSGAVDGTIKKSQRIGDSHSFEYKSDVKLDGQPIALVAGTDSIVYVLLGNNKLALIDVESFTLVKSHEFKDYEVFALTQVNDEIWAGDKKGLIHILNSSDLSEKHLIEKKHNHQVSYLRTSKDGKLVASGDNYRYIYVFNAETKAEVGCFTYHTAKIIHLDFNKDSTLLLTASLDLSVGVARLADKTKKVYHRVNEKELTGAVFDTAEDRFFTVGYDCSIRVWGK